VGLKDLAKKLFKVSEEEQKFSIEFMENELAFYVPPFELERIFNAEGSELLTAQYVCLKMLVEQEQAESIPNGFLIPSSTLTLLDSVTQELLSLPPQWNGEIDAIISGNTSKSNFTVELKVTDPSGRVTQLYDIKGPFIYFGEVKRYLLKHEQYRSFQALKKHKDSQKSEYDNLTFLYSLQEAKKNGCAINLSHFNKLDIKIPQRITIEAEFDSQGNLVLTPFVGQEASNERMQKVLGQISREHHATLKVGDEIILFDEEKLQAVKEIIDKRTVPSSKVEEFLNHPTAYIDSSLVDLDLGFSLRVHGATAFKHAYFGETDESGIDWFGKAATSENIIPISKAYDLISDQETCQKFEAEIEDCIDTGSTVFEFEGNSFDLSDHEEVARTLSDLRDKDWSSQLDIPEPSDDLGSAPTETDSTDTPETVVVDIDLNDEDVDELSPTVDMSINEILFKGELDWSNYLRTPFPHQETGVRWILGLLDSIDFSGGLLADDMGLGKTFMSLASVDQYHKRCFAINETCKPTLIVAPLSLLNVWKGEVEKTFSDSPFEDVVILQSDADLNKFRSGGVETKGIASDSGDWEPKYSLKVGKNFYSARLDLPKRLVITTYQTLRDYQFSLCLIDWGVVVFDEAQNIKNPNALATRAAKGLKADFKLVATGTPVENSLSDFWCLMDTACPGQLGDYQTFRNTYISPILRAAGDEVEGIRAKIGRELRINVGALMLRRLKEDNLEGLPCKNIFAGLKGDSIQYMPLLESMMSGHQLDVYDAAITSQQNSDVPQVLGTLQRLRDCSLHPRLVNGGSLEPVKDKKEITSISCESHKLSSLISLLDEIKSRQEKCIIFCVNKRLQMFLSITLGNLYKLGPLSIINGDAKAVSKRASTPTRTKMIEDFERKEGFNLIVMSPVAAGVGLTVIGANNVIHFERHWNPAKEAQATDRVYRIGQNKAVNVYLPILHHPEIESFDVNLHRLLTQKTLLKDAVVTSSDVLPSPEGFDSKSFAKNKLLSYEDISKLSWQEFEAFSIELLSKAFSADSAHLTKSGNDFGADGILMTQEGNILIQAKHTQGKYEGYKAIQEVFAAKPIYDSVIGKPSYKLIFITSASQLTKKTRAIAQECKVDIYTAKEIRLLLENSDISFADVMSRLDKKRFNISG
jgi:SNF2 family DNA or RNA helicase/HJR/Mrr/RecB family endonuclease